VSLPRLNFEMTNVVKRTTGYQYLDRYNNKMHTLLPPWSFGGYIFMIAPIDNWLVRKHRIFIFPVEIFSVVK
jgi:hypothetical protein